MAVSNFISGASLCIRRPRPDPVHGSRVEPVALEGARRSKDSSSAHVPPRSATQSPTRSRSVSATFCKQPIYGNRTSWDNNLHTLCPGRSFLSSHSRQGHPPLSNRGLPARAASTKKPHAKRHGAYKRAVFGRLSAVLNHLARVAFQSKLRFWSPKLTSALPWMALSVSLP